MARQLSVRASLHERAGALRHLPSLFGLVWQASPALTLASLGLRLTRAGLPVIMLYIGKLIIDEVMAQSQFPPPGETLTSWLISGRLIGLGSLVALECTLAITADLLGRASSLVDSLLSELYSNFASVRLMEHAATLIWNSSRAANSKTDSNEHAAR